jgi:putative drug exporter of the RND superfamily
MGRVRKAGDTAEVRGPLARLFAWLVAGPGAFIVIAAWIAAAVFAVRDLPPLGQSSGSVGDITPPHLPALQTELRSAQIFGNSVLSRVEVVQRDPRGLSPGVQQAAGTQALAVAHGQARVRYPGLLAALPVLNAEALMPKAHENGTTIITYLYYDPGASWAEQQQTAEVYARDLGRTPGASVVGVTGTIPARLAQNDLIFARLDLVEIATVLLIALIIGVTFRSLVAPIVALAAGVLSYTVALRVVQYAGRRTGFEAPAELQPLMVVLLLGIVTDYAVFLLSGFRRQLTSGTARARAARAAVAENAPIIATAGVMVAAGTAVLAVAHLRFFRAFGPGLALTVVLGLAVALTLVPALLAVLGRSAFWPSRPAAGPAALAEAGDVATGARPARRHEPTGRVRRRGAVHRGPAVSVPGAAPRVAGL